MAVDRNNPRSRKELTQVHRVSIARNLEHRLQVARAQGNQELLRLLEDEKQQLSL
jgi:hypothetical protein